MSRQISRFLCPHPLAALGPRDLRIGYLCSRGLMVAEGPKSSESNGRDPLQSSSSTTSLSLSHHSTPSLTTLKYQQRLFILETRQCKFERTANLEVLELRNRMNSGFTEMDRRLRFIQWHLGFIIAPITGIGDLSLRQN